jgi:AcrR family transcriptional regulator
MAAKQTDRRVKRTRQLLADALVSLMVERGYEEVTIQQILDRAGVGRSTFYVHFRDKEDLLRSSLENLRVGLSHQWASSLTSESKSLGGLGFALPLFQHLDGQRRLYRAIVRGESGMIVDRQLRRILAEMVRMDLGPDPSARLTGARLEAVVQFLVGALMSLITWWMEHEISLSAEEMNCVFLQLALDGLNSNRPQALSN